MPKDALVHTFQFRSLTASQLSALSTFEFILTGGCIDIEFILRAYLHCKDEGVSFFADTLILYHDYGPNWFK